MGQRAARTRSGRRCGAGTAAWLLAAAALLGAAVLALERGDPFLALEGPGAGRVYLAYRGPGLEGWLEGERDGRGELISAQLLCWPGQAEDGARAVYRRARQITRYYFWRYGPPEGGAGEYRWELPGGGEAGLAVEQEAGRKVLRVWYFRGPAPPGAG